MFEMAVRSFDARLAAMLGVITWCQLLPRSNWHSAGHDALFVSAEVLHAPAAVVGIAVGVGYEVGVVDGVGDGDGYGSGGATSAQACIAVSESGPETATAQMWQVEQMRMPDPDPPMNAVVPMPSVPVSGTEVLTQ